MRLWHLALVFVLVPVACSSSSSPAGGGSDSGSHANDSGTDAGGGDDATGGDAGGTDASDASTGDAPTGKPATPAITMVMQMSGALHVSWNLNDTNLDKVELWRKVDQGTYAVAYTLPGTATSQHDMTATQSTSTYCYQVVTYRGSVASDKSNEECASP